ncbi:MAG: hypothetical protein K6F50_09490 [Kiritimatiellae bacterium]|nr:hypothetical protein [Kiritimatiellia bacterium]
MSARLETLSEIIGDLRTYDNLEYDDVVSFADRLSDALGRLKTAFRTKIYRLQKDASLAASVTESVTSGVTESVTNVTSVTGSVTSVTNGVTKSVTESVTNGVTGKEKGGKERHSPQTPYREKVPQREIALPLRVSAARAPACTYAEEQPGFTPPGEARALATADQPERTDVPPLHVVMGSCATTGVPDWYARWWHRQMSASGWMTTRGQRVDNTNWRAILCSWYRRQDPKELAEAREADVSRRKTCQIVDVKPGDWALCRERCANCTGAGCSAGVRVPPDRIPGWPIPPEECPRFRALPQEGGAK